MTSNPPPTSTCDIVSVVIPTFNRARYVRDAIYSALEEGPSIGEVIVVDDGSTDDTAAVLQTVTDQRLRVLRQANAGWAVARNRGWRAAHGRWVMFLDSDDALERGGVEALVAAARESPRCIPFGQTSTHAEDLKQPPAHILSFSHRSGWLLKDICFFTGGTIFTTLLPREVLVELNGFSEDPEIYACADRDFAVRLALGSKFRFVPVICYKTRMHETNTYRDPEYQRKIYEAARIVIRRRLPRAPRHWLLRQRSQALYLGLAAQLDAEQGRPRAAAAGYSTSLLCWPIKLGAWRGLLKCMRQLARPDSGT